MFQVPPVSTIVISLAFCVAAFADDATSSTAGGSETPSGGAEPAESERVVVVDSGDAAVALSADQRLAFFRAYDQRRLAHQVSDAADREDRACGQVANVGKRPATTVLTQS